MFRTAVALAALAWTGNAVAQTSNCMNIGGGLVHCDNMGPNGSTSSTNCIDTGGGTANCNTMNTGNGLHQPRTGGSSTLSFIGGLIAQSQERSFRKKLSEMLATGNCNGAASLAFAHGQYGVSDQVRSYCHPDNATGQDSNAIAIQPTSGPVTTNALPSVMKTAEVSEKQKPVEFNPEEPYSVETNGVAWIKYTSNNSVNNYYYFHNYEVKFDVKHQRHIEIWVKIDHKSKIVSKSTISKILYNFDCQNHVVTKIQSSIYNSKNETIHFSDIPEPNFRIIPETGNDVLYNLFCPRPPWETSKPK